ncbi:Phosphoribosylaminoimidazole-succinocarboxamide synthase [Grifola frondosa]|uniref:Phosphoribosylaminoimidazole-succinocarboxamide synthase n=1 Tax=Grifola frondosa TaxID=5627 RepID=A0A1C7MB15_GRIFR|nr:Phosphoribosylaminoimidazole-succinocarboxamide synthase [Grifola frondosa]
MTNSALINSDLSGLTLLSKGKVRDVYATSDPNLLLFVATDRISAYDVILRNGVPDKGKVLTQISLFWFDKLKHVIPTHFVTADVARMPEEVQKYRAQLEGRTMLVRKAKVVPLEAIVRGYITGAHLALRVGGVQEVWHRARHNPPARVVESEKLPEPLFTPSTKAEQGQHDENISPEKAAALIGQDLYDKLSKAAVRLYSEAASYAASRGLILADTKFEFGLVPSAAGEGEELILVDELLTPDSSRYWPAASYKPGGPQQSFDKQYLRDWLVSTGFRKGLEGGKDGEGWTMEPDVVEGTRQRYLEALTMLTGEGLKN